MADWCKSCKYYGESSLSYPCVVCERAYDNLPTKHEKNVQETGWISVKDGLPDIMIENNNVKITETVIATDGEVRFFGNFKIYKYDNSFVFAGVNEDSIDEYGEGFICVTHWMSLPELPEGE